MHGKVKRRVRRLTCGGGSLLLTSSFGPARAARRGGRPRVAWRLRARVHRGWRHREAAWRRAGTGGAGHQRGSEARDERREVGSQRAAGGYRGERREVGSQRAAGASSPSSALRSRRPRRRSSRRFHARCCSLSEPGGGLRHGLRSARTREERVGSEKRSVSSREQHVLIDRATSATTRHAQSGSIASVCTEARKKGKGTRASAHPLSKYISCSR